MTFTEIITIISIMFTYSVYSSVNGFSDIIQKCLKVKGNVNLLINSILFMLLIRLVIDNVPIYLRIIKAIYQRITSSNVLEGLDGNSTDMLEIKQKRIDNLMILLKEESDKYDNMSESKEKDELFSKMKKHQKKIEKIRKEIKNIVSSK